LFITFKHYLEILMSNDKYTYFTTPAGRYVSGSIDIPKTKDHKGNPKMIKHGPDAGKPTQSFDFGIAIPKIPGVDWRQTEMGQKVHAAAAKAWPNGQFNLPGFSWKITDGDSTIPNTKMKRPCDSEGYPGHWVIYFSSNKAPQTVNNDGKVQIDPKSIKKGDWIQVAGSTCGNNDTDKPGMYMNHSIVSFQWAGDPITSGPDPSTLGFGATPAPAGVSTVPTGSFTAPAPTAPVAAAPVAAAPAPAMAPAPAAPTAVVPHTGILNPAPAAPPPPTGPVMTAKANGAKYEDFIKNGWNDATLRQHGYIAA
jgi:hypothetical protein